MLIITSYYDIKIILSSYLIRSYSARGFPEKNLASPGIVNQGRRFIFPIHCHTF